MELSTTITGIPLRNPLILAAGVLGTTGASLQRAIRAGAGAVVTKSIGPEPREGHPNPTAIELEDGLINAMGLPNPGYQEYREEIKVAREDDAPVIASVYGDDPAGFVEVIRGLDADAYELNISCPHAGGLAQIGSDPALVEEITARAIDATSQPVWVKLTPNVTDIIEVGLAVERGGADAVVAINTVRAMTIDVETGYPILGNKSGGLSGQAIHPIAVKAVYDLYGALDIPVVGVGGVSSWESAVELMMAGASAIELGTAVMTGGYSVFGEILDGMTRFLRGKGWHVEDIVGLAHEVTR